MGINQNKKLLTEALDTIEKNKNITENNQSQPPASTTDDDEEEISIRNSRNKNYVRRGGRKQRQKNIHVTNINLTLPFYKLGAGVFSGP